MRYSYPEQDAVFRVSVLDGNELAFVGEEGPIAGRRGSNEYDAARIVEGVWLLTWKETNGAIMTMVVDLVNLRVHAREVRDGSLMALEGTIEIVEYGGRPRPSPSARVRTSNNTSGAALAWTSPSRAADKFSPRLARSREDGAPMTNIDVLEPSL